MATVADHIVAALKRSGVHRAYGIPGDSLNGFTDAIRRDGEFGWELVRHEETAGLAAAADAALTGRLRQVRQPAFTDRARALAGPVRAEGGAAEAARALTALWPVD